MKQISSTTVFILVLSGFFLAFFLSLRIFSEPTGHWKHIITSDGRGYYAYLPAILIYGDLSFSTVIDRETKMLKYDYKPGYLVTHEGKRLNKYFVGEALLLLPFFLAGMLFSTIFGTPVDGYSFFFQLLAGLGSLFYFMSGIWFLIKILELRGFRVTVIVLAIVTISLATNLFYYGLWQQTMSHIFSFFAINGFLFFTVSSTRRWRAGTPVILGLFMGIILLIRPTNAIVFLLVPFFAGSSSNLKLLVRNFSQNRFALPALLISITLILIIQPVLWKLQTGSFLLWPYAGEGFNFTSPNFSDVLFSYRKGLFVYTPVIFFALSGLLFISYKEPIQWISLVAFIVLSTYVISSWWNWYYGDGLGMRAFIDYYGVYALLLACTFKRLTARITGMFLVVTLMSLFIIVNLIQTWQYTHNVLQPNSMNKDKFCYTFLRTDSAVINSLGGNQEMADHSIDTRAPASRYFSDFELPDSSWNNNPTILFKKAFSGQRSGYVDALNPFSPGLAIKASELGPVPCRYFIEGSVMVFDSLQPASNDALIVLSMEKIIQKDNWWQGFRLNDIPTPVTRSWKRRTFSLMTPEFSNPEGVLKIYIWNNGKGTIMIDDFDLRFYR